MGERVHAPPRFRAAGTPAREAEGSVPPSDPRRRGEERGAASPTSAGCCPAARGAAELPRPPHAGPQRTQVLGMKPQGPVRWSLNSPQSVKNSSCKIHPPARPHPVSTPTPPRAPSCAPAPGPTQPQTQRPSPGTFPLPDPCAQDGPAPPRQPPPPERRARGPPPPFRPRARRPGSGGRSCRKPPAPGGSGPAQPGAGPLRTDRRCPRGHHLRGAAPIHARPLQRGRPRAPAPAGPAGSARGKPARRPGSMRQTRCRAPAARPPARRGAGGAAKASAPRGPDLERRAARPATPAPGPPAPRGSRPGAEGAGRARVPRGARRPATGRPRQTPARGETVTRATWDPRQLTGSHLGRLRAAAGPLARRRRRSPSAVGAAAQPHLQTPGAELATGNAALAPRRRPAR